MTTALTTYDAKRAAAAAQYTKQVRSAPSSDLLSLKGGLFSLGEESLGDQLCVVVLNSVWENTYFKDRFVEGVPAAPTCYAYGRSAEEMAPHPSMAEHPDHFVPQSESCNTCPMNEWGSAPTGKGKACSNRERLFVIPAGEYSPIPKSKDMHLDLFDGTTREGQAHFLEAEGLVLKLPVTSVSNWNEYVRKLAGLGQPPFGVATRMHIERHPKFQYEVKFEMIDALPDEVFDILHKRNEEAGGEYLMQPYSPPRTDDERERRNGIRGFQDRR